MPLRLDNAWLKRRLRLCEPTRGPVSPKIAASAGAAITNDEEEVLQAYYGGSKRYQRARNVYALLKRKAKVLAGGMPFESIWPSLIASEWLAHNRLKPKLYRDHIFHPAAVAMLGWHLLQEPTTALRDRIAGILRKAHKGEYFEPADDTLDNWKTVVDHAWLVAGFFHDHCYPYEMLVNCAGEIEEPRPLAKPRLDRMIPAAFRRTLSRSKRARKVFPSLYEWLHERLDAPDSRKHCHAPFGAVSLLTLRQAAKVHKKSGPFADAVMGVAADAVARHHDTHLPASSNDYDAERAADFDFDKHPLRYLLVLCDGLHEFGRELLHRRAPDPSDGTFTSEFIESCTHAEIERVGSKLRICYQVNCAKKVCLTHRWDVDHFRSGREEFRNFINECNGPFKVVYPGGGCAILSKSCPC